MFTIRGGRIRAAGSRQSITVFNADRLNRMLQYEVSNQGLGVHEMLQLLINKLWKTPRLSGMHGLIQMQTAQVMLTHLLAASINNNNSFLVRSVLVKSIKDLKTYIETQLKASSDELYKAHLILALERMAKPEDSKPGLHREMPPGAPIGCDD